MRVERAVDGYLQYLDTVARRSPATLTAYRADLRRFQRFLASAGSCDLAQVTATTVDNWKAAMRDLSDATVRRSLNSLSGLFKWACRFGHALGNPLDEVERPRKRTKVQPSPTSGEIRRLLGATRGETERVAFLALATSGLRRSELLTLDWEHVDLPKRRLLIKGKGDKHREVLVFDDLLAALYALHAAQGRPAAGPVCRGKQGKRLQKSTLQRWLNRWLERADLREDGRNRYSLHSLRRYAAKCWLESGLNIRQVQLLLGHESLQTTILYLNYDIEEIQRAAESVDFGLSLDRLE